MRSGPFTRSGIEELPGRGSMIPDLERKICDGGHTLRIPPNSDRWVRAIWTAAVRRVE